MAAREPSTLTRSRRCDVSDALIKLRDPQVRNGGFLAGLTMWSPERQAGPTKIVGPAYTVQYSLLSDDQPKVDYHYVGPPQPCLRDAS
jgi:hypothetical protein